MDILFPLLLSFLAGISTAIGGMAIFFIKKMKAKYLCLVFGFSAGVMIFVSFTELLNHGIENSGLFFATLSFFSGIFLIYLIDILIPHNYKEEFSKGKLVKIKRTAILLMIGITIHNFPEGIAVAFSSIVEIKMGILVAIAIALHNIPEGIAVSVPIYYATKDRNKAFFYALISGLAEPLGAVIAFLFLQQFLNSFVLGIILSAVAGIMIFISFDELLPHVYMQREGHEQHLAILGMFLGMFVIALTLLII